MKKFEVWVTVWNEECGKQIKIVAGEFGRYFDAKLFSDAYANHYDTNPEIVEYVRK